MQPLICWRQLFLCGSNFKVLWWCDQKLDASKVHKNLTQMWSFHVRWKNKIKIILRISLEHLKMSQTVQPYNCIKLLVVWKNDEFREKVTWYLSDTSVRTHLGSPHFLLSTSRKRRAFLHFAPTKVPWKVSHICCKRKLHHLFVKSIKRSSGFTFPGLVLLVQ